MGRLEQGVHKVYLCPFPAAVPPSDSPNLATSIVIVRCAKSPLSLPARESGSTIRKLVL